MPKNSRYLSSAALVKRYSLPSKDRFYALCAEVGWEKIRITAATARQLGVDTSAAPRDWYYDAQAADQLWETYQGKRKARQA